MKSGRKFWSRAWPGLLFVGVALLGWLTPLLGLLGYFGSDECTT